MLAVSAGSTVAFPNFDPVFHNVFSTSHCAVVRSRHLQERRIARRDVREGRAASASAATCTRTCRRTWSSSRRPTTWSPTAGRLQVPQPAAGQVQVEGVGRGHGRADHADDRDQIGRKHRGLSVSPRFVADTAVDKFGVPTWKGALAPFAVAVAGLIAALGILLLGREARQTISARPPPISMRRSVRPAGGAGARRYAGADAAARMGGGDRRKHDARPRRRGAGVSAPPGRAHRDHPDAAGRRRAAPPAAPAREDDVALPAAPGTHLVVRAGELHS